MRSETRGGVRPGGGVQGLGHTMLNVIPTLTRKLNQHVISAVVGIEY